MANNAWAAADNIKSKAGGNNGRIQALEAEDIILHQRIDTIQLTPGPSGLQGEQGPTGLTGSAGKDGANGTDGVDGAQGAAGISCWDLNGNNTQDASEDVNNDGAFNALDCTDNVDLGSILQRLARIEDRLQNSDFDNDGYTPATGDCNDSEPNAFPGGYEIIGDNIDNNCDGSIDLLSTVNDFDGDGLTDSDEINIYLTDPQNPDSDFDSLPEKYVPTYKLQCYSVSYSCGFFSTCGRRECVQIQDGQDYFPPVNMSDGEEVNTYMTDPNLSDTDGDGVNDGLEIRNNTNPLDASSF
jgi:hypothetical protein